MAGTESHMNELTMEPQIHQDERSPDSTIEGTPCVADDGSDDTFSYQENAGNSTWKLISMGCGIYVLILYIVAIALDFSLVFVGSTYAPTENQHVIFSSYLFGIAAISVVTLLVLAVSGKLTKTDHYDDRQKTSFIRGGMVVLGTGALLYNCIVISEELWKEGSCRYIVKLIREHIRIVYLVGEISFIYIFTRIRINRSRLVAMLGRIMVSHMIVTNMAVWLIIAIAETVHELDEQTHSDGHGSNNLVFGATHMNTTAGGGMWNSTSVCESFVFLASLSPYLSALTIEYSVLISSLWLNVWENCGVCVSVPNDDNRYIRQSIIQPKQQLMHIAIGHGVNTEGEEYLKGNAPSDSERKSGYRNSGVGFILGWCTIVASIYCVLIFMYWKLSHSVAYTQERVVNYVSYGPNMLTSVMVGLVIPLIMYQMRILPAKMQHHILRSTNKHEYSKNMGHHMDQKLLACTGTAALIFKILCIIAALKTGDVLIAVDGFVCMLTVLLQTGFVRAYASGKICNTSNQRKQKPGRQGLEFLRCANFSLWLINTFILKDSGTKFTQSEVFGKTVWVIMSNIFQPLTILYYFHSMICVADVISDVYSAKNIEAVTRPA